MKVLIRPDENSVAETAYAFVRDRLNNYRINVLGLPAGNSPVRLYQKIAEGVRRGELDFAGVSTFNLDEFLGLPDNHPDSRRHFMEENLFQYVNLDPNSIHFPNGLPDDFLAEGDDYEADIAYHGGIKLQILGLGINGHIGMNEPGTSLESRTGLVTLASETIQSNACFFHNRSSLVPPWSMTMGIGTILDTEECLLIATGTEKAAAVAAMLEGPVSTYCPASALQQHKACTVIIDAAAASKLKRATAYVQAETQDQNLEKYLERARRNAGYK